MAASILVVDDDRLNLSHLRDLLEQSGYEVHQAESASFALRLLNKNRNHYALALVDYHMPQIRGDEAIRQFLAVDPQLQIVSYTGDDSDEAFQINLEAGALMVLSRAENPQRLLQTVKRYVQKFEDQRTLARMIVKGETQLPELLRHYRMVGISQKLYEVCRKIQQYAKTDATVLISGEHGTGKERVARAIHDNSRVQRGPFIAVNCAAVNEGICESELFGHTQGAFSGAIKARAGFFGEAQGGTIFLDEVGDMPLGLQAKLLRVIQEREITPVGSSRQVPIEVRIVAATNLDLEEAVQKRRFREDLYYRLNVLPIHMPPLRERTEDIVPLVSYFLERWNQKNHACVDFRRLTLSHLEHYDWPGNVRELENVVIRLLSQTSKDIIEPTDLDSRFFKSGGQAGSSDYVLLYQELKQKHLYEERELLTTLIRQCGTIQKAARGLKMARSSFYERLKNLGIRTRSDP